VDQASSTPVSHRSTTDAIESIGRGAVSAMAALSSPDFMQVRSPALASRAISLAEEEAEEESLSRILEQAAQQSVAAGTLDAAEAQAALTGDSDKSKLDDALRQLEVEPADEQACAAKFELYDGYAKLTSEARQSTLDLWASVQGDFASAPAVKAQIEAEIKSIDRESNLGFHDHSRYWFVHGMCSTTARNQKLISRVLSGVTNKLDLLSSQTECPICFEAFGPERPDTTLSCAHKACEECWTHWSSVNGAYTVPCPLCRHDQFLDRVLTAVRSREAMVVD